jgi:hypothetical protein
MLLQLQDYGTSLWQLGRYAIMLPGLFGRSAMVAPGAWHPTIFFCSAGGRKWITSISQFGPCPLLVEPDIGIRIDR